MLVNLPQDKDSITYLRTLKLLWSEVKTFLLVLCEHQHKIKDLSSMITHLEYESILFIHLTVCRHEDLSEITALSKYQASRL